MTQLLTGNAQLLDPGGSATHPLQVSARRGPPPKKDFQRLRKLMRLGHSYAVTIPDVWVAEQCNPKLPYVTTLLLGDGSILLRPFNPHADLSRP